jgi:hypothetical protein
VPSSMRDYATFGDEGAREVVLQNDVPGLNVSQSNLRTNKLSISNSL